jgi:uncharacterized membrane protein
VIIIIIIIIIIYYYYYHRHVQRASHTGSLAETGSAATGSAILPRQQFQRTEA